MTFEDNNCPPEKQELEFKTSDILMELSKEQQNPSIGEIHRKEDARNSTEMPEKSDKEKEMEIHHDKVANKAVEGTQVVNKELAARPQVANNESCIRDIFYRIRSSEVQKELFAGQQEKRIATRRLSIVLEKDAKIEEKTALHRRHPVLQATLSHDIVRKNNKAEKRRSLDDRCLGSGIDLAHYSPKEREILAMVIKNEEKDSASSSDLEKARNSLRPKILNPRSIVKEIKNMKFRKNSIRQQTEAPINLCLEKEINGMEAGIAPPRRGSGLTKKANIFRRLLKSASERLPITKVVVNSRESSVDSPRAKQRKYSLIPKKAQPKETIRVRRPSGNLELHAMLQEEYKRAPCPVGSTSSALNIVEKVEQARFDYSNSPKALQRRASGSDTHKGNGNQPACLTRSNSTYSQRSLESSGTFFEAFGKFKHDPFGESNHQT